MSGIAARVNAPMLPQYVSQKVRMVGKVKQTGEWVRIESPDGGEVLVDNRLSGGEIYTTDFVEVVGVVNADRSITQHEWKPFGNSFDLKLYNEAINLSNGKFKHLF